MSSTPLLHDDRDLGLMAVHALKEGVVVHDSTGTIVWSNRAAADILGLSEAQLFGRHPLDPRWRTVHADGTPWPGSSHPAMQTLETGTAVVEAVMGVHRPDGTLRWLSVTSQPSVLPDGTPGVTAIFVDITRHRAETDIEHQQALAQRVLFEHGGVPTVVLRRHTRIITDINDATCEWLGYERDELVGRHISTIAHADDQANAHNDVIDIRAQGFVKREMPFVHRDGSRRWGLFTARILPAAGDAPEAVICHAIDITTTKQLATDLERGRAIYRAGLEAIQEPLFVARCVRDEARAIVDFELRRMNTAAAVVMGSPVEALYGATLLHNFPELRTTGRFDEFCDVVDTGRPLDYEFSSPPGTPAARTFQCHVAKAGDGIVVLLHDVTERNRVAQELFVRQHQYRLLADYAGDVVMHKRDGLIEWVGPSITKLLGWTPEELVGTASSALVHPDDRHLLAEPDGDQAETQRRVRVRMLLRDGAWRWVEKNSRPLPDDDGTVRWTSIVSTIWDIQAEVEALEALARAEEGRRQLEQALEQAARLESLGVLAGGVAHDFNNLLTVILGNIGIVLDDLGADSPHTPSLNDAMASAERAAQLTKQLLAYAQRSPTKMERVDLSVLVHEALPLLRSIIPEWTTFHLDIPSGLPLVSADRSQLIQVVVNLVSNAAEALYPAGGNIAVRTFASTSVDQGQSRSSACIQVSDNGHGMSTETLNKMYEPFFSTKFAGRGLGLAAVYGIIQAAHGTIDAASAPNRGTTVTVHLPIAP